jgi:hypothetical protein
MRATMSVDRPAERRLTRIGFVVTLGKGDQRKKQQSEKNSH